MLSVKKPKILYRYFGRNLEKHKVSSECMPQVEVDNQYGVLFRCRCYKPYPFIAPPENHDIYGYAHLREARAEAIDNAKLEMYDLSQFVKKLTKQLYKV